MIMAFFLFLPCRVSAAEPTFRFELGIDGREEKEVKTGDIITVSLYLQRTDSEEAYDMYAMQDELRYDASFLELVDGSIVLGEGIASTDLALLDEHREFYMNFLSIDGGEQWQADTLIGSVQFEVIGESGVTKITSEDYLVSLQDGSGSYACEANEVTVIVSTECRVSFRTNGGSEIEDQVVQFGEKVERPEDPVREGYRFAGWYKDIHLNEEWNFEEDTVEGNMSLYAKWVQDEMQESTDVPEGSDKEPADDDITSEDSGMDWWWLLLAVLLLVIYFIIKKKKSNC